MIANFDTFSEVRTKDSRNFLFENIIIWSDILKGKTRGSYQENYAFFKEKGTITKSEFCLKERKKEKYASDGDACFGLSQLGCINLTM